MGGIQGVSRMKKKTKPTDLFCRNCLEETTTPKDSDYSDKLYCCEHCKNGWTRSQVLTFDEMIEAKFERVKHRNLNQLKRDMRP